MKKILFVLITLFMFSSNVYATTPTPTEEDTLTGSATANLWDSQIQLGSTTGTVGSQLTFNEENTYYAYALKYVKVSANKVYTLSYWNQSPATPGDSKVFYLDSNYNLLSSETFSSGTYGYHNFSFTTPDSTNYILFMFGRSGSMSSVVDGIGTNIIFQLSLGEVSLTSTDNYVSYEKLEESSPDTPVIDIKSSKIYVPDIENYKCFVVRSDTTIRAYKEVPSSGATVAYRDYYYTSNYLYVDGTQSFSNYSALPVCLDSSVITDEYVYRNDFPQILLTFVLFVGIIWFLISKLIKTFFFGFKRR